MSKTTNEKLASLIRLLATNHDGEAIGAIHAIKRILASEGRDLHALASIIEAGNGTKPIRTGGSPQLHAIAVWTYERRGRLDRRHHRFLRGMVGLTAETDLSPKQKSYLLSLHAQLGGKM
jgi:hypothetical protein